ncbi:MAG: CHASE domain-containing protein [Ignavibacteriaceae bacterium]
MNFRLRHFYKSLLKEISTRGIIISWIFLFILLFLTIAGWYVVKTSIEGNARERFHRKVNETKYDIQKRMLAYKQVLLGATGLFAASDSVTRTDWRTYISRLKIEENYPGILGIGFAIALSPDDVENHEKKIRSEGFPDYKVWPEANNEMVTSIIYLEPFTGRNLRAFGYDMFSDPNRRKAMIEARDKAKASLTSKVILVQETGKNVQFGFLMYMPVFKNNRLLITAEQKRDALLGFVYSPFRMNDLMEGIIGYGMADIHFKVYDNRNRSDSSVMYNSDSLISDIFLQEESLFRANEKVVIDGHTWAMKFSSLPAFEKSIDYGRPNVILITGLIISLLFFITTRSMAATRQLSRQLEQILESTGEGIFGVNLKGYCTFINKSAVEMLGYNRHEYIGRKMHNFIHHTTDDGSLYEFDECPIIKATRDGKERRIDSEIFWRADGSSFYVEYFANPIIHHGEIKGAVVTFTDITERLKSEEEVKELATRLKDTLESITDAFFTLDYQWNFKYLNKEAEKLLLKNGNELINNNIWEIFPEAVNSSLHEKFRKAVTDNQAVDFEVYFAPIGKWIEIHVYPSKYGLTVISRDISERMESKEKIEASLKEKDVLLKEIHHRVKNNLQIIASLLNLQLQSLKEDGIIEVLKESQNRIKSMALIHEKLYMATNMSRINFSNYVNDLIRHLLRSYNSDIADVKLIIDMEDINIDIDKTVSLGLAINELVSNSLKHAFDFTQTNNAEIYLEMKTQGDKIKLVVGDNGKGFPDNIDYKNTTSLGLQLVNALIKQIDGSITLESKSGTKFIVIFPV